MGKIFFSVITFIFFYHTSSAQLKTQELLYGNWYVTYIENKSDTLVCRKYNTPPYDWGTTYIFNNNGTFINSLSADEDTSLAIKGSWKLNEENNLITLSTLNDKLFYIKILSISEHVMQIKILTE